MNRSMTTKGTGALVGMALAAVVGCGLLLSPGHAQAEAVEDEKGIFLGLMFASASLQAEQTSEVFFIKDGGAGLGLDLGYRFNPVFMLELVVGGTGHATSDPAIDARTAAIQLFGHYRFAPNHSFRPYLKGGFGGYTLQLESGAASVRFNGGGVAFGGGFRFFFSRHFSLGVDLTHSLIRYDEAQLSLGELSIQSDIDEFGSLTTLGVMFGYSF